MQLGSLIALWGCAMQAGANNFACMLVGRIVAGFAIGYDLWPLMIYKNTEEPQPIHSILSMTVPLYNVSPYTNIISVYLTFCRPK